MAVQPAVQPSVSWTPTRKQFTVEEYYRLGEIGVIGPDERTELIEGEIYTMAPIGTSHANHVNRIAELLITTYREFARVSIQNPVRLNKNNEPQPDFALVKRDEGKYEHQHPEPDDLFLVIEVSGSSLKYDRDTKLQVYANANIPEVWIVDIEGQTLHQFREPSSGIYQKIKQRNKNEEINVMAFPGVTINTSSILSK